MNSFFRICSITIIIVSLNLVLRPRPVEAQKLPLNYQINDSSHQQKTGLVPVSGLYNISEIKSIYLNFNQPDFWEQLSKNYHQNISIPATLIYEGKTYEKVGVRFRGNTSFFQIADSEKKSFEIDLDYFTKNQSIEGYNQLVLNNGHEDATMMREVLYANLISQYTPSARANFVNLYLNGNWWGLYSNIQKQNSDFIKEWYPSANGSLWRATNKSVLPVPGENLSKPGEPFGAGTSGLNFLSDDSLVYQNFYTLKKTDELNPWEILQKAITVLNAPDSILSYNQLQKSFDIDATLWFLACELVFADEDSYLFKGGMDYLLYHAPETGQISPLEFDGNSTFKQQGIFWGPFFNQKNPQIVFMHQLMKLPEIRHRYLAHVRTLVNETLANNTLVSNINYYDSLISFYVEKDPKKLYTYNDYLSQLVELKLFAQKRKEFLLKDREIQNEKPTISEVTLFVNGQKWLTPLPGQTVQINAKVIGKEGISQTNLFVRQHWNGKFSKVPMFDDGMHNDLLPCDSVYGISFTAGLAGDFINFYVEAVSGNKSKTACYMPEGAEHQVFVIRINPAKREPGGLVINEILALQKNNKKNTTDAIEILNITQSEIFLNDYYLSDNPKDLYKWQFPEKKIEAGEFLVVWADKKESAGGYHANFKLNHEGDDVYLTHKNGTIADQISFRNQPENLSLGRLPNGTGSFKPMVSTLEKANFKNEAEKTLPALCFEIFQIPFRKEWGVKLNRDGNFLLEITDISGKTVFSIQIKNNGRFDLSSFNEGVYFVKIENKVSKLVLS